jgi:hypothetical protein
MSWQSMGQGSTCRSKGSHVLTTPPITDWHQRHHSIAPGALSALSELTNPPPEHIWFGKNAGEGGGQLTAQEGFLSIVTESQ